MESFIEEGSHATSPQLTMSKQTSMAQKARFEARPRVLRPQTTLALVEKRSDAMALVGSSGGHPRVGSLLLWYANVVPSHVLVKNLLTLSLQTFIAAFKVNDLDQVHRLREDADLALDVGRVSSLDIF